MRTSNDPLAPLRSWKELFLGHRAGKNRKDRRDSHREKHDIYSPLHLDQASGLVTE